MKLVARQGPLSGSEFPLSGPVTTIGRSTDNAIAVEDLKMSRRHAEIREQAGQYVVSDLGSTNGVLVNGVRISTPQVLRPGDQVQVGTTVFEVQSGAAPPPPATGPAPWESDAWAAPVSAGKRPVWVWLAGALVLLLLLAGGGVGVWYLIGQQAATPAAAPVTDTPAAAAGAASATPLPATERPVAAATETTTPTPTPAAVDPTSTPRVPTSTPTRTSGSNTGGTPGSQEGTPPYTVRWSAGGYEGYDRGRKFTTQLTIRNVSLASCINPPYAPYFVISDLDGNMRVGESYDYSSSSNPQPQLCPGQWTNWHWYTTTGAPNEWIRGSVFRYGGWSWGQEFNPDGSLNGSPYVVSDAQIPFARLPVPPEQVPTLFPDLVTPAP